MFQFIFLTDSLCGLMALFFSASSRLTTVKYTDQVIITSISQIDPLWPTVTKTDVLLKTNQV